MSILEKYKEDMLANLALYYDEETLVTMEPLVEEIINEQVSGERVRLFNNYRKEASTHDMIDVFDKILADPHNSIGVNGALFDNRKSPLAPKMLLTLRDMRKKNKGLMFQYLNESEKIEDKKSKEYKVLKAKADSYNIAQLDNKLTMNSYYGILGEANSIFYNEFNVGAVTLTGRATITTAIIAFENFFGNLLFGSFTELSKYLLDILDAFDEIEDEYFLGLDEMEITIENIRERFFKATPSLTEVEKEKISEFLEVNLEDNPHLMYLYYYRNNFYEYIKLPSISGYLEVLTKNPDFVDIDETISNIDKGTESESESLLNDFWNQVEQIVVHYKFYFNRYRRAREAIRNHVLTIDTDSCFVYLDPFYQYCVENYDVEDTIQDRVSVINIATYLVSKLIVKNFKMLTDKLNVPEELSHYFSMKNEFLIDRIILTSRKKWYAFTSIAQEGNIFDKPKLKIVGITIKKSTIHKNIRKYFKELVEDDFFAKDIDVIEILRKLDAFQILIDKDLNEGSLEYSKTERVNPKSNYVFPYRIGPFRGAVIWNKLYPGKPISFGEKCMTYKCTATKLEHIEALEVSHPEIYKTLKTHIFENENYANYGLSIISIPFSQERLPDWLIPYINVKAIVGDNLRYIYPLLESFNLRVVTVRGTNHHTNIIDSKLEI